MSRKFATTFRHADGREERYTRVDESFDNAPPQQVGELRRCPKCKAQTTHPACSCGERIRSAQSVTEVRWLINWDRVPSPADMAAFPDALDAQYARKLDELLELGPVRA